MGLSARVRPNLLALFAVVGLTTIYTTTGCGPEPHNLQDGTGPLFGRGMGASVFEPELGKGVDVAETRTFARCVCFPQPDLEPGTFAARAYDEFSVSSRAELNERMGVSASVAAKKLWGSASASVAHFRGVEIDESSFYWVVNAKYELMHESIPTQSPEFDLSDQARQLLREQGWAAFKATCGTHFYNGRTIGAQYALLYEFFGRRDRFTKNLKTKASGGCFGITASAAIQSATESANSLRSLQIHSDIIGGDHSVADYAESPSRLHLELAALREALEQSRRGVPIRWEMMAYDIFPDVVAAKEREAVGDFNTRAVDEALSVFYDRFNENETGFRRVRKLLQESQESDPMFVFLDDQRRAMSRVREALVTQNMEIVQRARTCISLPTPVHCSVAGLDVIDSTPPAPEMDFSDIGRRDLSLIPTSEMYRQACPQLDFLVTAPNLRHYDTRCRIQQGQDSLIYAFAGQDRVFQPIGEMRMITTPSENRVPFLCRGEYANRCNLRFINRDGRAADGAPNDELLLTMFDDQGSIVARNQFYPSIPST